jgi:hypothetical protein
MSVCVGLDEDVNFKYLKTNNMTEILSSCTWFFFTLFPFHQLNRSKIYASTDVFVVYSICVMLLLLLLLRNSLGKNIGLSRLLLCVKYAI